jgi:hypothetical protein
LLSRWGRAEAPSQEWRAYGHYKSAIEVLRVAMGLSRKRTRQILYDYVTASSQSDEDQF